MTQTAILKVVRACSKLGLTHSQTAEVLGKKRSTVAHYACKNAILFRKGRPKR